MIFSKETYDSAAKSMSTRERIELRRAHVESINFHESLASDAKKSGILKWDSSTGLYQFAATFNVVDCPSRFAEDESIHSPEPFYSHESDR